MPRAYPKEAFSIGTNQNKGTPTPQYGVPPPQGNQAMPVQQPSLTTPTATPQFYNPMAFGAAPPTTVPTPAYSNQPTTPVAYAAPTTVATAPALEPLSQGVVAPVVPSTFTSNVNAPPVSAIPQQNQGPRHAPPPTADAIAPPPSAEANMNNPPSAIPNLAPGGSTQMRGKRPLISDNMPLGSRSPVSLTYVI